MYNCHLGGGLESWQSADIADPVEEGLFSFAVSTSLLDVMEPSEESEIIMPVLVVAATIMKAFSLFRGGSSSGINLSSPLLSPLFCLLLFLHVAVRMVAVTLMSRPMS